MHKLVMACRHIFAVVLLLTIFSVLLGQFTSITPEFDRSTVTLFIGKEISAPPTFNCKSKPSKCTPCELNLKLHALLRFIKLGQFCLCILLSGDIAVNPGPNNLQPPAGFRGLSVCHWNIQRLTDTKLEELSLMLTSNNNSAAKLDVLILTETFGSSKIPDSYYMIPGYTLHRKDRIGKKGGGIFAYVNEKVMALRRRDLELDDLETLWLQICPHKSKRPILISGVYRPPSANKDYNESLGKNIENAHLQNNELIILGDFNLDYIDFNCYSKHYLAKALNSLGLTQMVNGVTRPASDACLDHIYSSHPARIREVSIGKSGLSDHLPVTILRCYKTMDAQRKQHSKIKYRNIDKINKECFLRDLREAPWDISFVFRDADDIVESWYKIFNDILDNHAPLKSKSVKKINQPRWFTNDLYNEINKRDNLLKRARRTQNKQDWSAFKLVKNKVTRKLRNAKEQYFKTQFSKNQKCPKKLWSLIKDLSKDTKNNDDSVPIADENNNLIKDDHSIAERFNRFFVDVYKRLIKSTPVLHYDALPGPPDKSNSQIENLIPQITPSEVNDYLLSIPTHKATGIDGLGARVLRIAAPEISCSIAKIINHCIETCTFPSQWKIAKVKPLFKNQGNKQDIQNYRPISILPILSKVFERHIFNAVNTYLTENSLLYRFQSGFRKNHSTDTALLFLLDQVLLDLDKNNVSGLVFVDYSKAFDLINHDILLVKLRSYRFPDNVVKLLQSYLLNRKHCVTVNNSTSSQLTLTNGVPQGSILGPLLFLIFVNDLPEAVGSDSTIHAYADDTTFKVSANIDNAPLELERRLQEYMDKLSKWSSENGMVLNAVKTNALLITGKRLHSSLADGNHLSMTLDGAEIEQVTSYKLLGVTLDQDLTFSDHISSLKAKLSQRIGLLKKIKRYLPIKERLLYYNALIKPVLMYGSMVWNICDAKELHCLLRLQKRAARVILGVDSYSRSVINFSKLGWLPFFDEIKLNKCTMIFKSLKGDVPIYIRDLLKTNSSVHNRSTRHGNLNLVCPKYLRNNDGGKAFSVDAVKLWNSLPHNIKNKPSIKLFKTAVKKYFISSYRNLDNFETILSNSTLSNFNFL